MRTYKQQTLFPMPRLSGSVREAVNVLEVVEKEGALVSKSIAAKILGVSNQRVGDFVREGRLRAVDFGGHEMLVLAEVKDFSRVPRKPGRPWPLRADRK